MGSFICQRYFQVHGKEIDGLILSATNGRQDPLMGFGILLAKLQVKMFGSKYRSHLIDKLSFQKFNKTFKPNRTAFDWLSRNTKEVDAYAQDPQCGFVCSALFFYYFFIFHMFKYLFLISAPNMSKFWQYLSFFRIEY